MKKNHKSEKKGFPPPPEVFRNSFNNVEYGAKLRYGLKNKKNTYGSHPKNGNTNSCRCHTRYGSGPLYADGESESLRYLKAANYKKAGQGQTITPHPCIQDWRKRPNPTRVDSKIHISTEGTTGGSDWMISWMALERCEIASKVRDNGEEHNSKRNEPLLVNAHDKAADGRTCWRWGSACWREWWT